MVSLARIRGRNPGRFGGKHTDSSTKQCSTLFPPAQPTQSLGGCLETHCESGAFQDHVVTLIAFIASIPVARTGNRMGAMGPSHLRQLQHSRYTPLVRNYAVEACAGKCAFAYSDLIRTGTWRFGHVLHIPWKRALWVQCQRELRAAGVSFGSGTVRCLVRGYARCTPSVRSPAHADSMIFQLMVGKAAHAS